MSRPPRGGTLARRFSPVATAFLAVALLHIFVLLALHTLSVQLGRGGFSFVTIGGDDGYFHYETARTMVSTGNLSPTSFAVFVTAWPSVMAFYMQAIGSTDILATKVLLLAPNLLLLATALRLFDVLDASAAHRMGNPLAKARLLVGIGVYPSLLSFSYGSLYRDAWIYCLFIVCTLAVLVVCARTAPPLRLLALLSTPFLIFALFRFRDYAAAAVLGGWLMWLTGLFFQGAATTLSPSPWVRKAVLGTLYAVLLAFLAVVFWGSPLAQAVSAYRNSFAVYEAGGNLGIQMDLTNPLQTILVFPYSFVSNVMGPLPWQVTSPASALNFLIEVPALAFVTYGLFKRHRMLSRADWLVLTMCLAYFFIIALANDNVGTAARLRVAGWVPIFVVYARVMPVKEGRSRRAVKLAV